MKKIIFVICVIMLIIFIYKYNNQTDNITLSFGTNIETDYKYIYKNTRLIDIRNDIDNNIKVNYRYIKNIMIKAKIIYIDLNNIYEVNLDDLDYILKTIRKYCKNNIVLIYKNKDDSIFKLADKYDIIIKR